MSAHNPSVYVAGPYSCRESIAELAQDLPQIGYGLSCRWLDGQHGAPDPGVPADAFGSDSRFAGEDLEDIENADVLIMLTAAAAQAAPGKGGRGGRHVETGYALALDKRVVIVGQAENIFHELGAHNGLHLVKCWHDAVILLASWLVDDLREMPTHEMSAAAGGR